MGEQALARNEALFREVNERIREITHSHDVGADERVSFLCECATLNCGGSVELTLREYEAVRSHPRVFVILPGHEHPQIERVVERHAAYALVEKVGEAGELAEETAP